MPIYLRNFYFQKLLDVKKTEEEAVKKASKKQSKAPTQNIPNFRR